MTYRGRFALGTLALVALALVALPSVAAAHFGFVGGFTQMGGATGAKWDLGAGTLAGPEATFGGESSIVDIAITPNATRAYAVKIGGEVVPFDVASGVAGTPIPLGADARAIAITPDGTRAYVASPFASSITAIDLATGTVSGTILVGSFPSAIAITPDGTRAYVANASSNNVSVVSLAGGTVIDTIAVGTSPDGIAITPDGTRAYVTNRLSSSVSKIDLATGTITATIPLGGTEPVGIAITPAGTRAYVPANFGSASEVVPLDLTSDVAGAPISTSGFLQDIAITPDGRRAYVPGESPEQVTPFDLATDTALSGFTPAYRPESVAVVPNQPPHASFTSSPASPAPGQTVSFSANPNDSDTATAVARYDWEFGDGSAAANAGATPTHTYAKGGTYTVTVTETDNEGCSTQQIFTGQTMYCNGSAIARTTRTVVIPSSNSSGCTRVKANAGTFVPKRRPGKVVPGVRVLLTANAPAKLAVDAKIEWSRKHGGTGNASLGNLKVDINEWRRLRFPIPDSLREELPLGTAVTVKLKIETTPRDASCTPTFTNRLLHLHVVKVFADAVQFKRAR